MIKILSLLAILSFSLASFAQVETSALANWTIVSGVCRAGGAGFQIRDGDSSNPSNSTALGIQICKTFGRYTSTGFSAITGGNGGPLRDAAGDLDVASNCSIKTSGNANGLLTCGSSN